jgi:hypothetical protein
LTHGFQSGYSITRQQESHGMETQMEIQQNHPLYPTDWGVRFLCDGNNNDQKNNVHQGIAHEISMHSVHILSDHHICQQQKIVMQVMIPSLLNCAPQKIVKIIGNSINTIVKEGKFLTEIEFQHFEENGLKELEKNLHKRFHPQFISPASQHA